MPSPDTGCGLRVGVQHALRPHRLRRHTERHVPQYGHLTPIQSRQQAEAHRLHGALSARNIYLGMDPEQAELCNLGVPTQKTGAHLALRPRGEGKQQQQNQRK